MRRLFAVIRSSGPAWREGSPMERQEGWEAHASFMNALAREGFVVAGGPLEGTSDVLLVARAGSVDEIRLRLGEDPWAAQDLLRITSVTPWSVRLGSLAGRP